MTVAPIHLVLHPEQDNPTPDPRTVQGEFDIEEDLKRNQIALINSSIGQLVLGSVLGLSLMLLFVWDGADIRTMAAFAAAILVQLAVRIGFHLYHSALDISGPTIDRVSRHMIYLAGGAGLIWGIGGAAFFDVTRVDQVALITIVILGMVSGSLPIYSAYLPVYYIFAITTYLPFVSRCFMSGVWEIELLGFGLLFTLLLTTSFARKVNLLFRQSLTLRHENVELIGDLEIKKQQAEQANIAKSRFLAAATHDLRQPLHALGFFQSTLRIKLKEPDLRAVLDKMDEACNNLVELFDGLFDNARIDLGEIRPDTATYSLAPLIDGLVAEFNSGRRAVSVVIQNDLPDLALHGDPVLLSRVLRNLISNGIKFSPPDSIVRLNVGGPLDAPFVDVVDQGPGIPRDKLERVFEEFYRIPISDGPTVPGAGLGLSIVRQLCRVMGIRIEVSSELDKGTRVALHFPVGMSHTTTSAPAPGTWPVPDMPSDLQVLVIDDDAAVLDSLSHLLTAMGVRHLGALNVESALTSLAALELEPNLLITDFDLGSNYTGFDAAAQLSDELSLEMKTILLTAKSDVGIRTKAMALGFEYLEKPCQADDLLRVLRSGAPD